MQPHEGDARSLYRRDDRGMSQADKDQTIQLEAPACCSSTSDVYTGPDKQQQVDTHKDREWFLARYDCLYTYGPLNMNLKGSYYNLAGQKKTRAGAESKSAQEKTARDGRAAAEAGSTQQESHSQCSEGTSNERKGFRAASAEAVKKQVRTYYGCVCGQMHVTLAMLICVGCQQHSEAANRTGSTDEEGAAQATCPRRGKEAEEGEYTALEKGKEKSSTP